MATVVTGPHAGDIHSILLTPVDASIGRSMADFARTHPHSNLPANACNHFAEFRTRPIRPIKVFSDFRTMHSGHMLREGARPEVVRDNMGHANIDVTQTVYGKVGRASGCGHNLQL